MRDHVAAALRDGVLQDLLAVSMLINAAHAQLPDRGPERTHELLEHAQETLRTDLDALRILIAALDRAAPVRDQP
jgi:signal transduction histidine kinase